MTLSNRSLRFRLAMVAASFLAIWTWPARGDVRDQAGFFDQQTVQKANAQIEQIRNKYHKDFVLETFAAIPDGMKERYNDANKNEFFEQWLRDRARTLQVNGIYGLICRSPAHIQVDAGAHTRERAFNASDVEALKQTLVDRFRQKQYNEGLLAAVELVRQRMDRNLAGAPAAPSNHLSEWARSFLPGQTNQTPGNSGGGRHTLAPWVWIVIIALGFFLLLRLVGSMASRNLANRGYGPGPGGYPPGAPPPAGGAGPMGGYGYGGGYGPTSGGGFGRSLMGGLLGGVAGNWLYSRFFGGGSTMGMPPSSANPQSPGFSPGPDDQGDFGGGAGGDFTQPRPETPPPDDFGGGGGDFGGGGGGGDAGSGGDF